MGINQLPLKCSVSQYIHYVIILGGVGGVKAMIILILQGVRNLAKVDYVICARSLISLLHTGVVVTFITKINEDDKQRICAEVM